MFCFEAMLTVGALTLQQDSNFTFLTESNPWLVIVNEIFFSPANMI
jgi:hypothetical protein